MIFMYCAAFPVEVTQYLAVGQNWVPKMEAWQMEPRTKTCGPIPGLILTHTHFVLQLFQPWYPLVRSVSLYP